MRFRRRPEGPPPDEEAGRSEWAPPEGDEPLSETGEPEVPEPEAPESPEVEAPESPEAPEREVAEFEAPEVPEAEVPEPEVTEAPEAEVDELEVAEIPGLPEAASPAPEVVERPLSPEPESMTDDTGAIRAAGGVVWTRWGDGRVRVAIVHRPRYGDWSLPKGKANPGETDAVCALREVREETGLACALGEDLGSVSYYDRKGRPKTVRYWAMRPLGGAFSAHAEIDQLRWVAADEAGRLLTHPRDAEIVEAFLARQNEGEEPPSPR